jgi:hypothetical protein
LRNTTLLASWREDVEDGRLDEKSGSGYTIQKAHDTYLLRLVLIYILLWFPQLYLMDLSQDAAV